MKASQSHPDATTPAPARRGGARRPVKRVAIIVEVMAAPRRSMLLGVARFVQEHEPWSIYLKPPFVDGSFREWIDKWDGDGIIGNLYSNERSVLDGVTIPIVDLLGPVPDARFPLVRSNDRAIGKLGAEHLMERGFKSFAFCEFVDSFWATHRREGFENRLREAGLTSITRFSRKPSAGRANPDVWEDQQLELAQWIAGLPKPVGIMTANDVLGRQILEACQRFDISVPDSVAVLGVDNDEPFCRISSPPLSSVIVDDQQRGFIAASILARMMDGEPPPTAPTLIDPVGIKSRGSTDVLTIDDDVIVSALRYLREHAYEPTSTDNLADALSISRSLLERRFRKMLGRSVNSEIVRLRVNRAVELLSETRLELKTIAARCGFSSQAYMTTVFTEKLGRTPGSFRH